MVDLVEGFSLNVVETYNNLVSQIPSEYKIFIGIGIYTVLITIYAIFIWKFYRFLARRDIIKLNLSKYNPTEHPVWNKVLASVLFFLEYIVIMPIVVFFWFAILSVFLLILSREQSVQSILLISAGVVGATRMTSYFSEDLSKDLAKMFPFTILAVFLLNPNAFNFSELVGRFVEIPSLINHILLYLVFVTAIEIVLRAFTLIMQLFSSSEETPKPENEEENEQV